MHQVDQNESSGDGDTGARPPRGARSHPVGARHASEAGVGAL